MSALGSVLGVYAGVATWVLAGEFAVELPAPATWAVAGEAATAALDVPVAPDVPDEEPDMPLNVWLMEISWSNWLRETI
jgi:hypothetical protein